MGWFSSIARVVDSIDNNVVERVLRDPSPSPADAATQARVAEGVAAVRPKVDEVMRQIGITPPADVVMPSGAFGGVQPAGAQAAPTEALTSQRAQGAVSVPTDFEAVPQVVVYGPDGQVYGNPLIAERAGVQDYSMTRPDFLQNQNVLPELGYRTVGPGNAPANVQPINQAPALSPQQAMQFLGGRNPFIRPQEQGIGSLFRRLMQQ